MNFSSKLIEDAVKQLSSLPGIGKRTALRLVLFMLKQDKSKIELFGQSFINLINNINYCTDCYAISEKDLCEICINTNRNSDVICVVEDIRILMAIENTMQFNGKYHVLGGLISPMDGISPSDLKIDELIEKIKNNNIKEVIFALSTTMEGDTTNYYLYRRIRDMNVKITLIARGIGVGDELEYTDEVTLGRSILARIPFESSMTKN